jgi:hypothetical protein
MIERWTANTDMPAHTSAGIAVEGSLACENSLHMKRRERKSIGCNSGAMVGIAWRVGIDRKAVGW